MNTIEMDILTPEQAAEYLQVNRETIYRYIRDGRLVASRLGRGYRISRRSIDLLLSSTRTRLDVPVRMYSDQQLADFLEIDNPDEETQALIRSLREKIASPSTHDG
jgi:excisionase family DNA binding protein